MSEWNRNDRDQGMRGRDFEDRQRRGDRDQWSSRSHQAEQRSFGGEDPDEWRRRDRESAERARMSGYQGGQMGQRYGQSSQGYGSTEPEWRRSEGRAGAQGYGGSERYEPGQNRDQGGAFGYPNEEVRRVADGDTGAGGFFGLGRHQGEHRGRGPKNYTRSDERIREDVNDRLADDSWLDASEIDVQVSNCEVTLSGTVNSREDKRRAEDLAEQVSGVKHVQNSLRVQQAETRPASQQSSASSASGQFGGTQPTGQRQ